MTTLTDMNPDAAASEPDELDAEVRAAPGSGHAPAAEAASLDAAMVREIVDEALDRREQPRRSKLASSMLVALTAGILALAAAGYAALRSDMRDMRSEIVTEIARVETGLRGEIADVETGLRGGIARINATLLDHTDRLARIETRLDGVETRLGSVERRLDGMTPGAGGAEARVAGRAAPSGGVQEAAP